MNPLALSIGSLLIGESDCEELGDGALAQPVNALTSLSYTAVGLGVIAVAVRRGRAVLETTVFGVCLVAVGLGSVLFHGPQPSGSRLLHDLPILWAALFIVVHDASVLRGRPDRWTRPFAVLVVVLSVPPLVWPDAALASTGLCVLALVVLEVLVHRSGRRRLVTRTQRRAYAAILGVAALAGLAYFLGRTSSPVCEPGSVLQFHGLWHLVSAAMFGLWWWLALWLPGDPVPTERADRSTGSPDDLVPAGSDR